MTPTSGQLPSLLCCMKSKPSCSIDTQNLKFMFSLVPARIGCVRIRRAGQQPAALLGPPATVAVAIQDLVCLSSIGSCCSVEISSIKFGFRSKSSLVSGGLYFASRFRHARKGTSKRLSIPFGFLANLRSRIKRHCASTGSEKFRANGSVSLKSNQLQPISHSSRLPPSVKGIQL